MADFCLSVTFVRPTQPIENFGNALVRWPSVDIMLKFYGDPPRGSLFINPKRMPSLKFKTSPYIRNGLTNSHKAWYGEAY